MGMDRSGRRSRAPQPLRRHLKQRQQVAAVCYRLGRRGIEFLLVQTSGGRWIFPKGGVECGLTQAQSAALEAFEEAGVHGRMEEMPFARYYRHRPDTTFTKTSTGSARSREPELAVAAYLCEVTRVEPPQEANRNPTWFSAEKAKLRLVKGRAPEFSAELARVVDRASSRIQRLHSGARHSPDRMYADGLLKVRFEAREDGRLRDDDMEAVLARYFLRTAGARSPAIEAEARAYLRKLPQSDAWGDIRRTVLRLGAGTSSPADSVQNITAIDSGRKNPFKPGKFVRSRTNGNPI